MLRSGSGTRALPPDARAGGEEVLLASRIVADGVRQTDLSVPAIHCGACMRTVETALGGLAGVESARVNLSTRRATVRWRSDSVPPPFIETLEASRLRGPFVRHRGGQEGRRAVGTDTRARGRGLRREQHHAAFGVDLVGRRRRDPRPVPLAVCDHRAAGAGLFRPDIFPSGWQACGTDGPTWTCRFRSACCSPSA